MNRIKNILLVEDDSVNQLVASLVLRKWGMQVEIANNGEEALAQIRSKAFQLVLMDIQMPVMDGFESTRRIREMEDSYFKTIPIIAFTASGIIEIQQMAIEKGMNDYINKPLVMEEFQTKIDKYLPSQHRPLNIDFNLYTGGDPDFKKELISHIINNVRELQQALLSLAQNATRVFARVVHKVASTVGMLGDQEFSAALEEIKLMSASGDTGEQFEKKVNQFYKLCSQVVESLAASA